MFRKSSKSAARILGAATTLILCLLIAPATLAQSSPQFYYGDIALDPKVYESLLREPSEQALDALPAAYDARDHGLVTPAKNQGACGSCWAFASTGALESHLLKTLGVGPEDFAEQQQVSCNTMMLGCLGGNSTSLRFWEAGGRGPIDESQMPYTANDTTACAYGGGERGYHVTNYHTVPQTTAAFKESLYNYGPSYWRYDVYSDFGTFWNGGLPGEVYVNGGGSSEGGHAVLIIGWDDAKGAFLCKNSWGGSAGPNGDGTFWIAYSGHANNLGFGMANFEVTGPPTAPYDIELGFCDQQGEPYCDGIGLNIVGEHVSVEGASIDYNCDPPGVSGTVAGPLSMSLWPFGSGISLIAAFNPDHTFADTLGSTELMLGDTALWRHLDRDGAVFRWGFLCAPPEGETLGEAARSDSGRTAPSSASDWPR